MEPAILWFLQKYESTSDCDPTIIEFLAEQLFVFTLQHKDKLDLFLLNECLSGICVEFEETDTITQNEISLKLLQKIQNPNQDADHNVDNNVNVQNATSTTAPTTAQTSLPLPLPIPSIQVTKNNRTKRRQRKSANKTTTSTTTTNNTISNISNSTKIISTNSSSKTIASNFFLSHGGNLDTPTFQYLETLLLEEENQVDVALPFIFANAPFLDPMKHREISMQFLNQLQISIVKTKKEKENAKEQKRVNDRQNQLNSNVIPLNLRVDSNSIVKNAIDSVPVPMTLNIPSNPSLTLLSETFPGATVNLLDWILNYKFQGDLQEASLYLLDKDLETLEKKFIDTMHKEKQMSQRNERDHQKLLAAERKKTLARYTNANSSTTHRPVPNTHDGRRLFKKKTKIKGEKETRYVDGIQIKVRKGQKKIVVTNNKEEWNGGSTGKVIRKSQAFNARR